MEQFNNTQITLLNEFIKWKADSAKTAFVNLLEILRCNCDLSICNSSKRFSRQFADEETTFDYLVYNGKRYNLIGDTNEEDNVVNVYVGKSAQSLTECLTKGIKDENAIKYLTENCNQILETFKDLSMISWLVEYTGQKGANQFKTKTGYLDIRCSYSTIKDIIPDGTILINLRCSSPTNPTQSKTTVSKTVKQMRLKKHIRKPAYYDCEYLKRRLPVESHQALVTHNDLDGIAVVVLALFNDIQFQEIYSCGYSAMTSKFAESLSVYDKVYVTDISFGEFATSNMITLDHHTPDTAEHCGAWLFYNDVIPMEKHTSVQERFVELVDIYDEWKDDHKLWRKALELNRIFIIERMKTEFWKNKYLNKYNILRPNPFMRFIDLMLEELTRSVFNPFTNKTIANELMEFGKYVSLFTKRLSFEVNRDVKCNSYRRFIVNENVPEPSYIAHKLLIPDDQEKEIVDYVIIEYESWSKYSLRSIELDLHIFEGFEGHMHAGTIDKEAMKKYLGQL